MIKTKIASCGPSRVTLMVVLALAAMTKNASRAIPIMTFAGLIICIVGLWASGSALVARFLNESFLVQGLFAGGNASVKGSTEGHAEYTRLALESFANHPWTGIGLGSQSQASDNATTATVITDGFHLSLLVEGGLLLVLPTLAFFVAVAIRLVAARHQVDWTDRWLPLAAVLYLLSQLAFAGFYNTGFYGKVPNLIFWVVFGAAIALARLNQSCQGLKQHVERSVLPHKTLDS